MNTSIWEWGKIKISKMLFQISEKKTKLDKFNLTVQSFTEKHNNLK